MSGEAMRRPCWHPLPEWFREQATDRRGAILLETAKFDEKNCRSMLFVRPLRWLIAETREEVDIVFREIDEQIACGRYVAGFVSYDCGEIFQGLPAHEVRELPLVRMGVFAAPIVFDHRNGSIEGADAMTRFVAEKEVAEQEDDAHIVEAALAIGEEEYTQKIQSIQRYLGEGHSYQVNFTDQVTGRFEGSPIALYRSLIRQQPVAYAAYIECGDSGARQILSLSPELFYRIVDGALTVRPMKGTWPRGVNLEDDERAAAMLRNDPKNRAEHVTIVDLLRNDVGKVCVPGSVRVEELMQVERYRTLHQMTSTISGRLDDRRSPTQVFRELFPSGSITGAPKRRTMEIIRELERKPRSIYTGAIGWFGPRGQACFNVAIRTLVTRGDRFLFGVGGGITVDSDAAEEYTECKLKAAFLEGERRAFHLIETMRAERGNVVLLEGHLRRLRASAAYFDIAFDEEALRKDLALQLHGVDTASRARLTLDPEGAWELAISPLDDVAWTGRLCVSAQRTNASDMWLHHKTSRRATYNAAYREARERGFDEALFLNDRGEVTEGAISNVFVLVDGLLLTPVTSCGVLPGVKRAHILETRPDAQARAITLDELLRADCIWYCNALRGSRPVTAICDEQGETLWRASRAAGLL